MKKQIIFAFCILILIVSVMGVNPHNPQGASTTTQSNVLIIQRIQQPYFETSSTGFDLYIHVFDSNATPLISTAVTCTGHFYNASGVHLLQTV